jgi:hypothetical protein
VTDLDVVSHSEFWPAFSTSDIMLNVMKNAAEAQVHQANAEHQPSPPAAAAIMNATSTKDVLIALLNERW